jgi:hypothetical protein
MNTTNESTNQTITAADTSPEDRVASLESKVNELVSTLAQTREALDAAERRHQIDLALVEADAVDLETARLLTELAVSQMDDRDVALAVRDLRQRKPFLFKNAAKSDPRAGGARPTRHLGAMGARDTTNQPSPLRNFANEAAQTGDRTALLRYLRARRGE